jgi:hypothetical protein
MAHAEVDRIISGVVWTRFPELLESVQEWVELAGDEGEGIVLSAFEIGREWISIRVTRTEGDREDGYCDWLEWLIPISFGQASPLAIDHFVAREIHQAVQKLEGRRMTGERRRELPGPESFEGDRDMAPKSKAAPAQPKPPASAPTSTKRAKPAPAPAATATKRSMAGPKKPMPSPAKTMPAPAKAKAAAPAPSPSRSSKPKAAMPPGKRK